MKRACSNCGVDLKKRMKNIACVRCHAPMCEKCGSVCKDCLAIKEDKKMITDYFRDKYAERSPLLHSARQVLLVLLLALFLIPMSNAWDKHDFLSHVETKATSPISSYSQYLVCNPTAQDIVIDGSVGKKLEVWFDTPVGELKGYDYYIYKQVTINPKRAVYEDHEHSYTCDYLFNYTVSPKFATCYHVNGTVLWSGSFETSDIPSKTVYWTEYGFNGYSYDPVSVWKWKKFNPIGKTMYAGECYDVRIKGTYTPGSKIDNIMAYADYEYPEYAWWNISWDNKRKVNFTSSLNKNLSDYPVSFEVNLSGYGVNTSCQDVRFLNADEDTEYYFWTERCTPDGENNSIFWVNFTSVIGNGVENVMYMYYGNDAATRNNSKGGHDTFAFFDDASSTNVTDYWSIGCGTWTYSDGYIKQLSNSAACWAGGAAGILSLANITEKYNNLTFRGKQLNVDDGATQDSLVGLKRHSDALVHTVQIRESNDLLQAQRYENGWGTGYSVAFNPPIDTWMDLHYTVQQGNVTTSVSHGSTFVGKNFSDIEWNRDEWDNLIGLYTYQGVFWYDDIRLYEYANTSITTTVGGEEASVITTTLNVGIYNSSYGDISNFTDEGNDFYVWANYSYDDNSSSISDSFGFCNYSAVNISDEQYSQSAGVNITVCESGCDSANYTASFSGFDTGGYIYDIFRFRVCHNTNRKKDMRFVTSCGADYTVLMDAIPLCSAGYINYSKIDGNCSGSADFNVSVWNLGKNVDEGLRLVDTFVGVDRLHNHSQQMIYNGTLERWQSPSLHEYYTHGSKTINVSCFYNTSGVENQSQALTVVVENIAPVVIIDSIWWWLLSVSEVFSAGKEAKYPLESFLNVTFEASDDDLDTVTCYLNYSNGTNIFSDTSVNGKFSVNFTQANFSTNLTFLNGANGYTFSVIANDTSSNVTSVTRSFTARNVAPVSTWTNASGQSYGAIPIVFNWTASDAEEETPNCFLYQNGSLNSTGASGISWSGSPGTYNLSVNCEDSFWNSTQDDLLFTYVLGCQINYISPCKDCRYADDTVLLNFNCTNAVTPDSCHYSINGFSNTTISNCSSAFNFTAELGKNVLTLSTVNGGVTTTSDVIFFAKKQNSTIWQFPVILFGILIILGLVLLAGFTRIKAFYLLVGVGVVLIGISLWALTWWLAVLMIVAGILTCFATVMR